MNKRFDPWPSRRDAVTRLVDARAGGATLRRAAAAAGVHPATACRWRLGSPVVAAALRLAVEAARQRRRLTRVCRPWVNCHPSCPACAAAVEIRTRVGDWSARLWLCGRRPACAWKSWRPRHPADCPGCGGPRYWSHSRKSVSCPACGTHTAADPADVRPIPADRHPLPPPRPIPPAAELLARAEAEVMPPPPAPPPPAPSAPPPPGCVSDGMGGFIHVLGRRRRV
jgi:hypothetical protein